MSSFDSIPREGKEEAQEESWMEKDITMQNGVG